MPVANTSIQFYRNEVLPKLNERQEAVYEVIRKCAIEGKDITNKEVSRALGWEINCITPRMGELVKIGVVKLSQERPCTVTKNKRPVRAWTLSGNHQRGLFSQ